MIGGRLVNMLFPFSAVRGRLQRLLLVGGTGAALVVLTACGGDGSADAAVSNVDHPPAPVADDVVVLGDGSPVLVTDDVVVTGDEDVAGSAPVLTPAERYLADAIALLDEMTAASNSVATALNNADMDSEVWRTETASELRELAAFVESAAELEAPREYAAQHLQLVDSTSKYSWATQMLADGIETMDLNAIDDAATLLANASVELATAKAGLAS